MLLTKQPPVNLSPVVSEQWCEILMQRYEDMKMNVTIDGDPDLTITPTAITDDNDNDNDKLEEIIQSIVDQVMISFQSLLQPESRSHYRLIYILGSFLPDHAHRFLHRLKCVQKLLISPLLSTIVHTFPVLMKRNNQSLSSSSSSTLSTSTSTSTLSTSTSSLYLSSYLPLLHRITTTPSLLLPFLAVTDQQIPPSLLLDFQKHIPQLLIQAFIIQDEMRKAVDSLFLRLFRVLDQNHGDCWNDKIHQEFWKLVQDSRDREAIHGALIPIDQITLKSIRDSYDYSQVLFHIFQFHQSTLNLLIDLQIDGFFIQFNPAFFWKEWS